MTARQRSFCVDCGPPLSGRIARTCPWPGPRCTTHHRAKMKVVKERAHANRINNLYGITKEQYNQILVVQNGVCAICGPWTGNRGLTLKLAVDEDHNDNNRVRGLLCKFCNRLLGRFADNPEIFQSAINYLKDPPARKVLE